MKKIAYLITAAAIALAGSASTLAEEPLSVSQPDVPEESLSASTSDVTVGPSVYLNGEKMMFDAEPFMENDRVLVPMRAIFEACGAAINWDSETLTVSATKENEEKAATSIVVQIDNNTAYIDGEAFELDCPAKVVNDRTFVPVRFVVEALGEKVDWNQDEFRVEITAKNFKAKYTFDYLLDNSVTYDLNRDGNADTIKTDVTAHYWRYSSLIINDKRILLEAARHGHFTDVYVTDIDTSDNYLDIIALSSYKSLYAYIYRYDGEKLLIADGNYEVSSERDAQIYNEYAKNLSITTGDGSITFNCGGEIHSYDNVTSFKPVDAAEKYTEAFEEYKDILANTSFEKYAVYIMSIDATPVLVLSNSDAVSLENKIYSYSQIDNKVTEVEMTNEIVNDEYEFKFADKDDLSLLTEMLYQ